MHRIAWRTNRGDDIGGLGLVTASPASRDSVPRGAEADGAGNIKSVGTQTFVYDTVSRLVTANISANGINKQQTASFDAFGSITSTYTTDWGTQTLTTTASTNRLTNAGYDAGGDMTYWGGFTYTWDALGKLKTVTGTGGVNHTYLYTADGERIADRDATASSTTITVRDLDAQVLRTFIESGTSGTGALAWGKDYIRAGRALLAEVSANPDEGTRYFALDHLGTPRLVTSACAATLARHDYYPFGMEATSSQQDGERMKFTGHERDLMGTYSSQTDDLDNMHARFYNPIIARFLSPDALRGDPHSLQSFNLFAYVQGNPMAYIDPSGLQALEYHAPLNQFHGTDNFPGLISGSGSSSQYWGVYGTDPYAWQNSNWWAAPYIGQGGSNGGNFGGPGMGGPGTGSGATFDWVNNVLEPASNFCAGWGDTCSLGLSARVRDYLGDAQVVDTGSWAYLGGRGFGVANIVAIGGAASLRPFTAPLQVVTRWHTGAGAASGAIAGGSWVMTGGATIRNWLFSGTWTYTRFANSVTTTVPGSSLTYPPGWQWFKGFLGQRWLP